ncbi:hypothetical protein C8Q75DRAFT_132492 [Abortiporus biennis]|nr:hypothetical protein C8Q75DRAFT_132492 [Abortiporus biennis]
MQRQGDFMKGKENHDKDMITQSLHRLKCDYKLDTALINSLEAIRRSITKPSYPSKIDGIIYFHRIDDCDTASYSYEHIFQPAASIFGITDAHLAIVVTGWESEEMTPLGMERREKKLKDDPILFRPILEKKAKMLSYRRNSDSHSVMNDIIIP